MLPILAAGGIALMSWGVNKVIEKCCEAGMLDDDVAEVLEGVVVFAAAASSAAFGLNRNAQPQPTPGGIMESMHPTTREFLQSRVNAG